MTAVHLDDKTIFCFILQDNLMPPQTSPHAAEMHAPTVSTHHSVLTFLFPGQQCRRHCFQGTWLLSTSEGWGPGSFQTCGRSGAWSIRCLGPADLSACPPCGSERPGSKCRQWQAGGRCPARGASAPEVASLSWAGVGRGVGRVGGRQRWRVDTSW